MYLLMQYFIVILTQSAFIWWIYVWYKGWELISQCTLGYLEKEILMYFPPWNFGNHGVADNG